MLKFIKSHLMSGIFHSVEEQLIAGIVSGLIHEGVVLGVSKDNLRAILADATRLIDSDNGAA